MGKINAKPVQKVPQPPTIYRNIKTEIKEEPPDTDNRSLNSPPKRKSERNRRPEDDIPSTSGIARKRIRLESQSTSRNDLQTPTVKREMEEPSVVSTRRRLKTQKQSHPKCCYCQEEQTEEDEPVKQCVRCQSYFHITKCLRYSGDHAENLAQLIDWHCPRCVRCFACNDIIADPYNIECASCCNAFHGQCASGVRASEEYNAAFYCNLCNYKSAVHKTFTMARRGSRASAASSGPVKAVRTARPAKQSAKPVKPIQPLADSDEEDTLIPLEFENQEKLVELINDRDKLYDKYFEMSGFSSTKTPDNRKATSAATRWKACPFPPYDSDITHKPKEKRIEKLTLPADRALYNSARAEAYANEPVSKSGETGQWLHFATANACKALCKSAFKEPLQSAPHLYICKFCLHTTNILGDFDIHFSICCIRHPPGNEIYRKNDLAFFEVDGAKQKEYCQSLCLIAKLFISSKTLYVETETFTFYVLCEIKDDGYVFVGYFSKEKNPSKNNNLSCLLVLPQAQKMGYGRMLIDMSYELSRIEHRVGHPEHPLSDLGILAYRGYWRSSLLCYLRSLKNTEKITMKEICLQTRITLVDIANQLMLDNLIVVKNSKYYIKIGKRALKYPLSASRRRAVDPKFIIWAPKDTEEKLDPRKINTYI